MIQIDHEEDGLQLPRTGTSLSSLPCGVHDFTRGSGLVDMSDETTSSRLVALRSIIRDGPSPEEASLLDQLGHPHTSPSCCQSAPSVKWSVDVQNKYSVDEGHTCQTAGDAAPSLKELMQRKDEDFRAHRHYSIPGFGRTISMTTEPDEPEGKPIEMEEAGWNVAAYEQVNRELAASRIQTAWQLKKLAQQKSGEAALNLKRKRSFYHETVLLASAGPPELRLAKQAAHDMLPRRPADGNLFAMTAGLAAFDSFGVEIACYMRFVVYTGRVFFACLLLNACKSMHAYITYMHAHMYAMHRQLYRVPACSMQLI